MTDLRGLDLEPLVGWVQELGSQVKEYLRSEGAGRYLEIPREHALPHVRSHAYLLGWVRDDANAFAGLWAYLNGPKTIDLNYGFGSTNQSDAKKLASAGDRLFPKARVRLPQSVAPTPFTDSPVVDLRPRAESFYGVYIGAPMSIRTPPHELLALDIAQFVGRTARTLVTGKEARPYKYPKPRGLSLRTPYANSVLTKIRCPKCKSSLDAWDRQCGTCGWGGFKFRTARSPFDFEPSDT